MQFCGSLTILWHCLSLGLRLLCGERLSSKWTQLRTNLDEVLPLPLPQEEGKKSVNETEILLENLGQDNILLAKERGEVVKEKKWSSQALLILEFYTLI